MTLNHNTNLLRHSAYINLNSTSKSRFIELASDISDWDDLITQAESAALSALLYAHLNMCEITIPDVTAITFKALLARHTRSNRERTMALKEILDKFNEEKIDSILLKGMALINTLYDSHFQRPMGDIDILVKQNQALLAQDSLRDIGFRAGDRKQGYLFDHHHLPVATRSVRGMLIQIEIHHDALSGDATSAMPFDAVRNNAISILIDGRKFNTLSHIDMLRHLCHHTFEPCDKIKLGAISDIYGYSMKYFEEIDWNNISSNHKIIVNTLRCLHFLTPLPDKLSEEIGKPVCSSPDGVGKGFPPLSTILNKNSALSTKFKKLLFCSEWWLHIFYLVPPEKSLFLVKTIRHPVRVCFWIARRAFANLKSKMRK